MGFEDRTCWMIRPPARERLAEAFVDRGAVSVAWTWTRVGDLDAVDDGDVFLALESAGHAKAADDLRDLRMFQGRIGLGDVVVVPDRGVADLLLGEVTGPYRHDPDGGAHRHLRDVRWIGRVAERDVDDLLLGHLSGGRQWIRRLPEQTRWQRLAGEVADFLGRDPEDVPRTRRAEPSVRRGASGGSSGGGSRTSGRAAAAPRPTPVPDRLCPVCGLLRAPSLFPDGDDVCRDCA